MRNSKVTPRKLCWELHFLSYSAHHHEKPPIGTRHQCVAGAVFAAINYNEFIDRFDRIASPPCSRFARDEIKPNSKPARTKQQPRGASTHQPRSHRTAGAGRGCGSGKALGPAPSERILRPSFPCLP